MTELEAANARLKASRARCTIQLRGRSLSLVATLPLRDGPGKKQQRITLGEVSIIEAERKALELGHQLRSGAFSWDSWVSPAEVAPRILTFDRFREALIRTHSQRYLRDPERGAKTWQKNWEPLYRRLPEAGAVTEPALVRVIEQLPAKSSSRRNQGTILAQVAESLEIPTAKLRKTIAGYGPRQLRPRDIPSDPEIEDLVLSTTLPHWRWCLGMLAAYGLRPHELEEITPAPENVWIVAERTKTGSRQVYPCHSRWYTLFDLGNIRRPPPSKLEMSARISKHLRDRSCPYSAYALRHAFAIRLMERGVPPEVGCRLMGHSLQTHETTYKRWLQQDRLAKAIARLDL